MPKGRSASSLSSQCLGLIIRRIDRFAQMEPLEFLPRDLLERLFTLLKESGPANLSRANLQLIITRHLNRIDLSGLYTVDLALDTIVASKPNLVRIDLSNVLFIPDLFWNSVIPSLSRLEVLNLRSTNCGDRELLIITNYCRQLRHLDLSLCQRVTNLTGLYRGRGDSMLQHLDLMQTCVDEQQVRQVLEGCPSLVSLKWRNTINVLGQIYRTANTDVYLQLQQLFADASYRLYSLPGAVRLCRSAVQVMIDCPSHLSARDLRSLEHLDRLNELYVVSDHCDYQEALDGVLVRHGATLRHLTLGKIRNVDLGRIAHLCRQLSSLELERNQNYCGELIVPRIESLEKLTLAVRDQNLNSGDDAHRDIAAFTLGTLLSAGGLKRVKITASHNVNEDTLSSLGDGLLETLELESCHNLSMGSLCNVISRSNELSVLKVYRCRNISDRDMQDLSEVIAQMHWALDLDYYHDSS